MVLDLIAEKDMEVGSGVRPRFSTPDFNSLMVGYICQNFG